MNTVMDYCCSQMDTSTVMRLKEALEQKHCGLLPLNQFQEKVMGILKPWERRRLKREIKEDFKLAFDLTDHFLARLLTRYGNENVDYLMDTVRTSYRKARSLRKTNIYAGDSVIICDPQRERLVSIYPRATRKMGRYYR